MLGLAYNSAGQLSTLTTPDGRAIGYAYDALARLAQVRYPDGKTRGYLYENAAFPQALTGIVDESGLRLSTYAYDAQGRAVSTELAGGVGRYQVSYPGSSTASSRDWTSSSRTHRWKKGFQCLRVDVWMLESAQSNAAHARSCWSAAS